MVEQQAARPQIYGMVAISALIGVVNLARGGDQGLLFLELRDELNFPSWYVTHLLFTLGVGVFMLIAAYLMYRFRKRGLQIGLVVHILYAGNALYNIVLGGRPPVLDWLMLALSGAAIFLIYRHLTHDPERLLFSEQ
jgi:hypothetical protein